jgi:hypothetical protein
MLYLSILIALQGHAVKHVSQEDVSKAAASLGTAPHHAALLVWCVLLPSSSLRETRDSSVQVRSSILRAWKMSVVPALGATLF